MKTLLWITMALMMLHTSYSYILLTANMEDVHALAKQMATSPVVHEIGKIWRRASNQFRRAIAHDTRRHGASDDDEDSKETDWDRNTRRIVRDIIAFAKNTGYLGPMKRAMEIIDPKLKNNQ
ncbi:uncharacterized protein LOC126776708 isoform X2 [Nymphalis io]|uniref:uncharacterized protein LOC126776708 isoform X2 n=1 Tax=Inachis io TaxID=171585 RepID=UPI002168CA98|nr:uncharacterized protein LOC126776708 isoform X2 [Nymphalis io]